MDKEQLKELEDKIIDLLEWFRKNDDDFLMDWINDVCQPTNEPPDVQTIEWI